MDKTETEKTIPSCCTNDDNLKQKFQIKDLFIAIVFVLMVLIIFWALSELGLLNIINVSDKSSLFAFFILGLIAGVSSCASLVGGLVLSMKKTQPHILFNLSRLVSFVFFGALLGGIGSQLRLSASFTSLLVIAVSLVMIILAFRMLNIAWFNRIKIPYFKKILTRTDYMPLTMGFLTFFLPCGFTMTAQSLALISGSFIQGALIMLMFALGTLPMLIFIGFTSVKFSQKPKYYNQFNYFAAILILIFAFFNINNQFNILGWPSVTTVNQTKGLSISSNNQQIIKMNASSQGYSPNYFQVKAGVPVRWEITDMGTSGCTNAIIAKGLFNDEIKLIPGKTVTKEFTPEKPGKYAFSCWMGMISGTIEVI
ncbi:MAG: sulfite exporter TauE/SafE family protein [Patescibacteria group bacterium]|jgi:sulfite exporter TauE/SafE